MAKQKEEIPLDHPYDNMWVYKSQEFLSKDINGAHGFIYAIEELSTGKIYVGQKVFWTKKIKTINKKKKKIQVESDWKNYYSSSAYINEMVEKNGYEDYKRYIIALVKSDGMLNYIEMKIQMDLRVLEFPEKYINGYIGGRISRSHISSDKLIEIDDNIMTYIFSK